jgi:hypothetical protein
MVPLHIVSSNIFKELRGQLVAIRLAVNAMVVVFARMSRGVKILALNFIMVVLVMVIAKRQYIHSRVTIMVLLPIRIVQMHAQVRVSMAITLVMGDILREIVLVVQLVEVINSPHVMSQLSTAAAVHIILINYPKIFYDYLSRICSYGRIGLCLPR